MSIPDTLMPTDTELSDQIDQVKARFDVIGCNLRLWINDNDPEPTWTNASYVEAAYPGYAAVDLVGRWEDPVRDEAGVWSFRTDVVTFEPTGGGEVIIQGIALDVNGTLRGAGRLQGEFTVAPGIPLGVRVIYSQYASIILAELALL